MYSSNRGFGEYNSLDDYYLQGYFTNKQLRKELKKAGLVNRDGPPPPQAIYRTNLIKSERRRKEKEELTKSLVEESINLQWQHENEIKSRLEEIAKLERIRRLRLETRNVPKKTQTKVKKKDANSYLSALDKKDPKRSHPLYECHAGKFEHVCEKPVDPSAHIKTLMTMQYLGDDNDLIEIENEAEEEIEVHIEQIIYKQKPIWIYLGKHKALDIFKFNTYRHPTFPFCLNMYINGMLHLKIHSCCEYRFPIGTRLGGQSGKFILLDVQGCTTCGRYECENNKSIITQISDQYTDLINIDEGTCTCHRTCAAAGEENPFHASMHIGRKCSVTSHIDDKSTQMSQDEMHFQCPCQSKSIDSTNQQNQPKQKTSSKDTQEPCKKCSCNNDFYNAKVCDEESPSLIESEEYLKEMKENESLCNLADKPKIITLVDKKPFLMNIMIKGYRKTGATEITVSCDDVNDDSEHGSEQGHNTPFTESEKAPTTTEAEPQENDKAEPQENDKAEPEEEKVEEIKECL